MSEQHWKRMLTGLLDGVPMPLTTRSMPKMVDQPKEAFLDGITIVRPKGQAVSDKQLNGLDWWDYEVDEAGFDASRKLEWAVLRTKRRGARVQIVWARKPRRGDSQSARAPVAPRAPQESGAMATTEV